MRKLVTAGFIALFAALAAPTAAFANTDYLTFSNQTAEQWTLVSYSVSAGATFTRGGLYADPGGYEYSVINAPGAVDYTVVWQAPLLTAHNAFFRVVGTKTSMAIGSLRYRIP